MALGDCTATVEIAGTAYACREYRYTATVLALADRFTSLIPAPGGKVQGTPVLEVANMGDPVTLYLSDPAVQGGAKIAKLRGRVTGRNVRVDAQGTVLQVTGADLGWHLSSCGPVFRSLRGLSWIAFASQLLGLTVDAATGKVTSDKNGWGFVGFGASNVYNLRLRLGRQAAEQHQLEAQLKQGLVMPRIQVEVGQTLDALMVQYARLDGYLVNVSTDGWIQIFKPAWDGKTYAGTAAATLAPVPYSAPVSYTFEHPGNVLAGSLSYDEDGSNLYSDVQCWNTVIDNTLADKYDPNWGRYHGSYKASPAPFSFRRSYTFTDSEQYGTDPVTAISRVSARAKWQWQRFAFDALTITFDVVGHSQGGVPYVEDSRAIFRSSVLGLDGVYYVVAVEPYRRLAHAGFDSTAGSRTRITLKRDKLLGA